MEDLIQAVADKTGLTPDQARSAISVIVDHLKDKLPLGLGDQLESFLGTSSSTSSDDSSTPSGGDGLLGGLKDKLTGGLSGLFS